MVTVSRRNVLPLLAAILAPTLRSVLSPNPIRASGTPYFLPTTTPTERGHIYNCSERPNIRRRI
jgi:hypothetical protein